MPSKTDVKGRVEEQVSEMTPEQEAGLRDGRGNHERENGAVA